MSGLKDHGRSPALGRHLLSLSLNQFADLPASLELSSRHFIVFIAADSGQASVDELSEFGRVLLAQGAVVLATWGKGCERLHDIIDETDLELHPDETDQSVVLTTWHDDESLADALWFAVNTISPAPAFTGTCNTVLAISVGDPRSAAEIVKWLSAPEQLAEEALGSTGVSDGA